MIDVTKTREALEIAIRRMDAETSLPLRALSAALGQAQPFVWVKWMQEGGRTHRWLAWAEKDQPGAFPLYILPADATADEVTK